LFLPLFCILPELFDRDAFASVDPVASSISMSVIAGETVRAFIVVIASAVERENLAFLLIG